MKKHSILKKFASLTMAAGLMLSALSMTASAATVSDFTDVKAGSWYYTAVDYAASNGLFSGTSLTTFSPDAAVTRGMFVTVLGKRSGVDTRNYLNNRFSDVRQNAYYAPYIEWAATYNIVSGTGGGKFSPEAKITREQMATILYKYAEVTENDTQTEKTGYITLLGFTDTYQGKYHMWAEDGLGWAVEKGLMKGDGGRLDAFGTATRAQCAQVLYNARELLVKTEAYTEEERGEHYEESQLCTVLTNGKPATPENVTELILSLKDKYPEGSRSTNCTAFAVEDIWKNVFGEDCYSISTYNPSFDEFQPGDLFAYRSSNTKGHDVIIVRRLYEDDGSFSGYEICEGNYNEKVHWGRVLHADSYNGTLVVEERGVVYRPQ